MEIEVNVLAVTDTHHCIFPWFTVKSRPQQPFDIIVKCSFGRNRGFHECTHYLQPGVYLILIM